MKPTNLLPKGPLRQVLIVSGDATVRTSLQQVLRTWAIETTATETGRGGLERIAEQAGAKTRYRIAVVDSQLPDMTVAEFVERLRARHREDNPKLIALVEPNELADVAVRDPLGASAYVAKPTCETGSSDLLSKAIMRAMLDGGFEPMAEVDPAPLLERLDGDRELLADLIDVFVGNRDSMVKQIEAAIADGDAKALQLAAHRAKGAICNLDSGAAYLIADRLERLGHRGDLSEARDLAGQLWTRLDELVAALQRLRQEVAS